MFKAGGVVVEKATADPKSPMWREDRAFRVFLLLTVSIALGAIAARNYWESFQEHPDDTPHASAITQAGCTAVILSFFNPREYLAMVHLLGT